MKLITNFDQERIQSLYSNLSSLNIIELFELRDNYKKLNYSLTEVNLQLLKLITYPVNLLLMCIFFFNNVKNKKAEKYYFLYFIRIIFSVIIYYLNNFFLVLGNTEKITVLTSILHH